MQEQPGPPRDEQEVAMLNMMHGSFKHLNAVSTASLLVIFAYARQFNAQPQWRPLLLIALAGFTLSAMGALGAQYYEFLVWVTNGKPRMLGYLNVTMAFVGFVCGVLALAAFMMVSL